MAWFIGITSVTWYLAVLAYGAIVVVRYWFALAFDRIWPSLFAYLSPKFGTPIAVLRDATMATVQKLMMPLMFGFERAAVVKLKPRG